MRELCLIANFHKGTIEEAAWRSDRSSLTWGGAYLLDEAPQAEVAAGRELRVARVQRLHHAVRGVDAGAHVPLLYRFHMHELRQLSLQQLTRPHEPVRLAHQPRPSLQRWPHRDTRASQPPALNRCVMIESPTPAECCTDRMPCARTAAACMRDLPRAAQGTPVAAARRPPGAARATCSTCGRSD